MAHSDKHKIGDDVASAEGLGVVLGALVGTYIVVINANAVVIISKPPPPQ